MGTRGFIIIKFNNKYYAIYNPYDSYPSELGKKIIEYLMKLIEVNVLTNTQHCLDLMIEYFTKEYKDKENFDYYYSVEDNCEMKNFDCQWMYTIDLEKKLFTIKGYDLSPLYAKYSLIKDHEFSIFNCMYKYFNNL